MKLPLCTLPRCNNNNTVSVMIKSAGIYCIVWCRGPILPLTEADQRVDILSSLDWTIQDVSILVVQMGSVC